jgi:uncharacterized protein (TIGR02596 family)
MGRDFPYSQGRNPAGSGLLRGRGPRGFTLLELLVVIAIISVLGVTGFLAVSSLIRSSNLTLAGQLLGDQFALARQEATTRNTKVTVRIYNLKEGGADQWRGVRILQTSETKDTPLGNLQVLPTGVVICTEDALSPLFFGASAVGSSESVQGMENVEYREFSFTPNGRPRLHPATDNYVTLKTGTDKENPPANYYTIQVNPLTGRALVYRP